MDQCKSGSKTYLNYECYEYMQPKFDEIKLTEKCEKNLRYAVEKLGEVYPISLSHEETFKELSSRLNEDGVFITASPRIACSYINYLLNKKLRRNHMYNNNLIYDFFKKFVREYYISDSGRYDASFACDVDIKRLDDKIYNGMTILYELYDLYYKLKSSHENGVNGVCYTFGLMIKKYNDLKKYELKDVELIEKILYLNKLTESSNLHFENICPDKKRDLNVSYLYLTNLKDDIIKRREEEEALQERLRKEREQAQLELERAQREREHEEKLKSVLTSNGEVSDTVKKLNTKENDVLLSKLIVQEGESVNSIFSTEQEYLKKYILTDMGKPLIVGQKKDFEQSKAKNNLLENHQVSEVYTPGLIGSFQNTISEIKRDIEPAPVLGVSGGMGALYLLLRYTPVGSFFGGGRRQMRQIRRNVEGLPPGVFPYDYEYDAGYVGYGPVNIPYQAE